MSQQYILKSPENGISALRRSFDSYGKEWGKRSVNLNKVYNDMIVRLGERPEFSPHISVFQIRGKGDDAYIFSEFIHVSNEFIDGFESFLRSHVVMVRARDFEDVPQTHRHWWETPFTLVPCDIERVDSMLLDPANGDVLFSESIDIFRGVDADGKCALNMIPPDILDGRLGEIESEGNYTAVVRKGNTKKDAKDTEFLAIEYKSGFDHFLLTNKAKQFPPSD